MLGIREIDVSSSARQYDEHDVASDDKELRTGVGVYVRRISPT